jgi:hypothetical protein
MTSRGCTAHTKHRVGPKPDAEGGIHDATQIKVTSTQPAPSMSPCIVILLDEDFIGNDAYYIVLSVVKL